MQWSINTTASGMWWEQGCNTVTVLLCEDQACLPEKKHVRIVWPSFLTYWILANFGHTFAHIFHESSGTSEGQAFSQGRRALLRHFFPFADRAAPAFGCRMSGRVFVFFLLTSLTVPALKDGFLWFFARSHFPPTIHHFCIIAWHPVGHFLQRSCGNPWHVIYPSHIEPIRLSAPSGISPSVLS